jgi:lipopolysaccharide/colanic/teichoic acid biosynthesis glycosyltransferase
MLSHTEEYSRIIDTYLIRHRVKPGVTGLAQINGYRGPTDELWKMEKRVEYDVWYLENWSLLMDVRCIFMTVYNAVRGEENAL